MAKKILLGLVSFMVVIGGIAVMSAYEAHVINVTAHIEDALSVSPKEVLFGTVFPQEYLEKPFLISLSESFMMQDRVGKVAYEIKQKMKPCPVDQAGMPVDQTCVKDDPANPPHNPTGWHYQDLCQYLSKLPQDPDADVGAPSYYDKTTNSCPQKPEVVANGVLNKLVGDIEDNWLVDLKVPPVAKYVGQEWPAGCPVLANDSQTYGCDLWVEVNNITSGLINGGFETGGFTGWNVNFSYLADVVTTYTSDGGTVYNPVEGSYFAVLNAGAGAGVYTVVSQTVYLTTGQKLAGWAAFDAKDYLPYDDDSAVVIISGGPVATPWSKKISDVGNYGESPWQYWSWTAPADGNYTLELKVANQIDNGLSSTALFDANVILP